MTPEEFLKYIEDAHDYYKNQPKEPFQDSTQRKDSEVRDRSE